MRWKYDREGDIRVRNKFCLFPLSWNGTVYWLEMVVVTERYTFGWLESDSWNIIDLTLPVD